MISSVHTHPTMTYADLKYPTSYRFQVASLMPDGKKRDFWTDSAADAHDEARAIRERNPEASRVVVYDHCPIVTEF